ncbi:6,7-dimethyl-8-ribityllumazine synthase [Roseateles sp. YR242]|uniref:6,7-dimethyl-8-ribityllumazine synthase n=1 Tax=Roseateles sp. YR242 TaxID=1855305 RepID=UPI000B82A57F|nr:6,7-dimethyl-8-ribityllumazine synthase [Roseateles sp. YR242]
MNQPVSRSVSSQQQAAAPQSPQSPHAAGASGSPPRTFGSGHPPRIAIVSASWHADLVGQCRDAAVKGLEAAGPCHITHIHVPGAFETPLHALKLARSGQFDAVLACALVVDGGIYRHDFVAQAVIDGLMRAQMDTGVPVFSAVLTPLAFHEHAVHHQFFHEHLVHKGTELAAACVATLTSLRQIEALSS